MTIFKTKETEFIFGAFTTWDTASWDSSNDIQLKSDPNAFIFSLTNEDNKPYKMKFDADQHECVVYKHPENNVHTNEADKFLDGSQTFQFCEIEVYRKD